MKERFEEPQLEKEELEKAKEEIALEEAIDKAVEIETAGEINEKDSERVEMMKEEARETNGIIRKFGSSKLSKVVAGGLLGLSLMAAPIKKAEAKTSWGKVAAAAAIIGIGVAISGRGEIYKEEMRYRREIDRERIRAEIERRRIEAQIERERIRQETELRREELRLERDLARAKTEKEREAIRARMKIMQEALKAKSGKTVELTMEGQTNTVKVMEEENRPKESGE